MANGIPLSNHDCINPKKFKNLGILGSMLEHVREILLDQSTNPSKEKITPGPMNPISSQTTDTCLPNYSTTLTLPVETTALSE